MFSIFPRLNLKVEMEIAKNKLLTLKAIPRQSNEHIKKTKKKQKKKKKTRTNKKKKKNKQKKQTN